MRRSIAVVALSWCVLCACKGGADAEPAASAAPAEAPAAEPEVEAPASPEPAAPAEGTADETGLAVAGQTAELGKPAPDFTLTASDGASHTLSSLRGKTVVLEWFNPDCPFSKFAHTKGPLAGMAKERIGEQLVWLSINSGGPGKQGHGAERNQEALSQYGMVNPILMDPTGQVGHAYGAEKTPHMFVIDAEGVLVYRGGIDNAPIGRVDPERPRYADSPADAVVNYVDGALQDLRASQPLRLSDTPAYGCSVKYSS